MNRYLDIYENNDQVISVHGFMYPVKKKLREPFFLKGADCWGWATWKRGWELFEADSSALLARLQQQNLESEFNFNGSYDYLSMLKAQITGGVDSWAIRWYASAFLNNKLTLYPPVSLIRNIGFDGSGTHGDVVAGKNSVEFNTSGFEIKEVEIVESKKNKKLIEKYFRGRNYYLRRAWRKLKSAFKTKGPTLY
jgi:hypothetical protein